MKRWVGPKKKKQLPIKRIALLIGMVIASACFLPSQILLGFGSGAPATSKYPGEIPDWYLDTLSHEIYQFHSLRYGNVSWGRPYPLSTAISMRLCAGMVVFHTGNYQWVHTESKSGWRMRGCICGDSLLWGWSDTFFQVYQGGQERRLEITVEDANWWRQRVDLPDTLAGALVLCVAEKPRRFPAHFAGTWHTWGIVDANARWLIPPIFDAPFRFQNGFADVLYYGQKRKINERGEFVE